MPRAPETWEQALDAIEARLDAADAALDSSTLPVLDGFEPPAVIEGIPEALADRARTVLARGDALQRRLEEESARIRAELRHLPRFEPGRSAPRFEIDA
jgi:hypothetical protein